MAESKWAMGLGSVNLAASALIATFTIFAFTGQNELSTVQGKQSARLRVLWLRPRLGSNAKSIPSVIAQHKSSGRSKLPCSARAP